MTTETDVFTTLLAEASERRGRREARKNGVIQELDPWKQHIDVVGAAVNMLYEVVQTTRREDFRYEQVLWRRHHEQLVEIKRKLDSTVM